jgi:nucleoside-diphosphate-sugar epimerase
MGAWNPSFINNFLEKGDRVLITGAAGWFGRCAFNMFSSSGLRLLAMGSKDKLMFLDGLQIPIYRQSLKSIREFNPSVIIDTAFLTRDKLAILPRDQYIKVNQDLINDSLEMVSLPSVRKYVGFSSGATVNLAGQSSFSLLDNPYGALKLDYEARISELSGSSIGKVSVARVWSVSGPHVTKPESFAFSDLIAQARTGKILIRSHNLVIRRYCAISEVISVALADRGKQGVIFDTGGELIEIGELAEIIKQEVNPAAEDRKSTRLNSSHTRFHQRSRMPSSA